MSMINQETLVSVILPVYNVYPYLSQCLDSIMDQTYKNIEVIIVIDGATDGSYELAKQYCERDCRFSVYWQENAGSGPARNNGLSYAKGKFVMCIDPDDWVKEDYVERFLEVQREGDYDLVTATSVDYYFTKDKKVKCEKIREIADEEFIGQRTVRNKYAYLLQKGLVSGPANRLYKMEIIRGHNVTFPDLRRSQDIVFNYRYYDCISSVRTLNYHGYCYRIEFSKSIRKVNPNYYKIIKRLYNETVVLHKKWGEGKNIPMIATHYTAILNGAMELCVVTNQPISTMLYDEELQEIVKASLPHGHIKKCFKYVFLIRNSLLMKMMMGIKHFIKVNRLE